MSKSSAATAPKLSTPLSQKSAWARGPPNTSSAPTPRSQSPAPASASTPTTSHSRRPSTLGQGVSFKDGVGARSSVGAPKSGSAVTFGSIDDASAPISSSPASVPPIKSEVPKTFGSVTATATSLPAVNGKPSASSSTSVSSTVKAPSSASKPAFDVKKLFQGSSSGPSSQPPSDSVSSPSTRTSSLPQHPSPPQASGSHTPQNSQFGNHAYQPFVPSGGLRPQPNGVGGNGPPRSPVYPRQVPNGSAPPNGRPPGGPGTPGAPPTPMSAGMPSPRMGPPHPGQPAGLPSQPVGWTPYYYPYPGMPAEYMYPQAWQMPHVPPQHQHPHTPGVQGPPHQPPHQHQHQQPGMPMSPRHPPSSLHTPGTPTLSPASVPVPSPSPHMHTSSLSSLTSPPSTPASSTGPGAAGGLMDRNAKPFVPGRKVVIKNDAGQEVLLENFKKHTPSGSVSGYQSPISVVPSSPARKVVRMETEEAKTRRLAEEEKAKKAKDDEEKAKKQKVEKAKRDEEERIRKQKEEVVRLQKEQEDAERRKKEDEEKEQTRKEEEEKERLRKEEEEKERMRLEAEELARKEAENKERERKEAEEKARAEAEAAAAAAAAAAEAEADAKAEAEAEVQAEARAQEEAKPEEAEEGEVDDAANEETRDKVLQDKPPLRLDTALSSPTPHEAKKRPGPLDLSGTRGPIVAPLPSALATARVIEDLGRIDYPEGIQSPQVELNLNAKHGKFRYDRDFLLQFMAVCKEKPDSLPPLDAIGMEPTDQNFTMSRGGSGRRQSSASGMGPPSSTAPRQASVGLGITGFGGKPATGSFNMGQFATAGKSSEERFAMSNRSSSISGGPQNMPLNRPSTMVRSSSQGGPGGVPMGNKSGRTRSQRGGNRGDKFSTGGSQQSAFNSTPLAGSLEPVAPLELSVNRWTPGSLSKKPQAVNEDSPEVVDRKVKGLLNKLTMEKFDSISDQIIAWANRSEKEKDGRTLIQVIRLVFEKATDEATWSEMYARLCRKMMEQISPKVQDDGIRNPEGKHITGGHLFRKYLLNRCQEDFERGWASKESTAAAAATKASEDAKVAANGDEGEEAALYSEEYYAAQKAKRQGLGLIKFIGELFKLQMLTERIMHECVKKLLGNVENPEEEEIESLCKLLTTVGALLDTQKAHAHMDVYFSRMKELTKSPNVNSRMQFMLQDITELRERKWIPRNLAAAPTTLAAVHEAAAKDKEKEQYQRTLSMSRGGSRRGGDRGEHQVGPDGWAVAGSTQPRAPPKAGDLSNFGKINKTTSMSFGPSSIFAAGKKESKRDSTISRTGSMNMFSMLSQNAELANETQPLAKSSRPPSRKSSIDLGSGGAPEAQAAPMQRRKLNLLPRSVQKSDDKSEETPAASAAGSEDEGGEVAGSALSEEEAKKQIGEDIKEFFQIRDLGEAEVYFTKLPVEHRHRLVDQLVMSALEKKDADAELVANLFSRAASRNLCSPATFEEGFTPTVEILDDVAIDVPKAYPLFVTMAKGAGLDKDEERYTRLASKSSDSDKLLSMLTS